MSRALRNLNVANDLQVMARVSIALIDDDLTDNLLKLHGLLLIAIQLKEVNQRPLCLPTNHAAQMAAPKVQQANARSNLA